MMTTVLGSFRNPAQRRLALTATSGALIALAALMRYALGQNGAWAALMTLAALVAGSDIAVRAWQALRVRHISIELLVTLAAGGALVIGEYWEAAAVTFLFMLGAWLEARTMRQTRGALSALLDAAPSTATVLRGGEAVEVAPHEVRLGETVLVKPGGKIPVDGEVTDGAAAVDESAITGEPIPAEKAAGSRVFAGTIAHNGLLRIRATGVGADTTLARIVRRVEDAQEERAPTQRLIERFAQWYTPAVVALAALAFLVTRDVRLALTLLVVACPGALVISTPVSVVAGIGRAARAGILIKGGQHLENAGRITALALDKTGTLTEGKPRLAETIVLQPSGALVGAAGAGRIGAAPLSEAEVVRWAGIAEAGSGHPLGRPIVEAALADGPLPAPESLEEHAGMGVVARHDGREIAVGSRRLLAKLGTELDAGAQAELDALRGRGRTPVLVALDGEVVGLLGLADQPRSSAAPALARLGEIGVGRLVMLTGDDRLAAQNIATHLGIREVHAELLPEQKLAHVQRLRAAGEHVAMVGDGINDAPALAAADVSIAMGAAGSDVAIETADIALMTDDLGKIAEAVAISRATLRNLRQNLVIALVTVSGLLAGVLAGSVHMAGGMLIHQLSVLVVVANGMRLLRWRPTPRRVRIRQA
jgi:Cd2+/Zn2+-exporting ATPase